MCFKGEIEEEKHEKAHKNKRKLLYSLDELQKKCYDNSMENTNEINRKIADNLIHFRKAAGYTQAELAEKINYSDKSVSKWESGNGIPDVYTLLQLAELYGVTLDAFVGDGAQIKPEKKTWRLRFLIMLLSSGIVWLVATCLFVALQLSVPQGEWWRIFVFAVTVNAILLIVFAGIWKYRILSFISISALIWTAITNVYLTLSLIMQAKGGDADGLWLLFVVGIPLQVLAIGWGYFRALIHKNVEKFTRRRKRKKEKAAESKKEENYQEGIENQ